MTTTQLSERPSSHPKGRCVPVYEKDLIDCNGDACAAALIHAIERCQKFFGAKAWITKSVKDWRDELLGIYAEKEVRRALAFLQKMGRIKRQSTNKYRSYSYQLADQNAAPPAKADTPNAQFTPVVLPKRAFRVAKTEAFINSIKTDTKQEETQDQQQQTPVVVDTHLHPVQKSDQEKDNTRRLCQIGLTSTLANELCHLPSLEIEEAIRQSADKTNPNGWLVTALRQRWCKREEADPRDYTKYNTDDDFDVDDPDYRAQMASRQAEWAAIREKITAEAEPAQVVEVPEEAIAPTPQTEIDPSINQVVGNGWTPQRIWDWMRSVLSHDRDLKAHIRLFSDTKLVAYEDKKLVLQCRDEYSANLLETSLRPNMESVCKLMSDKLRYSIRRPESKEARAA